MTPANPFPDPVSNWRTTGAGLWDGMQIGQPLLDPTVYLFEHLCPSSRDSSSARAGMSRIACECPGMFQTQSWTLECMLDSGFDQGPPVWSPWEVAPNPVLMHRSLWPQRVWVTNVLPFHCERWISQHWFFPHMMGVISKDMEWTWAPPAKALPRGA